MKKLSLLFFVAVMSIAFVACGDSEVLSESQMLDSKDLQVKLA